MFITIMSFLSLIMIYMTVYDHELLSFVDEISQFLWCAVSKLSIFIKTLSILFTMLSTKVFSSISVLLKFQND